MSDDEPQDLAEPEDCLAGPGDAETEEDWTLDHGEEFQPGPIPKVFGADGLPSQSAPVQQSDVPPLSLETLVCMADTSEFVVRDNFGDILCSFQPDEVDRSPEGVWRVPWTLFEQRMEMRIKEYRQNAEKVGYADAKTMDTYVFLYEVFMSSGRGMTMSRKWVSVEPKRRACRHYGRKHVQYDMAPDRKKVVRLCMARQDTSGAFMSVSDRAVWACELRNPPVLEHLDDLDSFDQRKIAEGEQREYLSILDPSIAGGIFGGKKDG